MSENWKPRSVTLLAALAAVVALSAPALAQRTEPPGPIELNLGTTLATPPLFGGSFSCQVVNIGPTAVLVAVKIRDNLGTNLSIFGDGSDPVLCTAVQQLQPAHACEIVGVPLGECSFPLSGPCGLAYCKITVVGNKDAVRGSLSDDNGRAVEAH